MKLGRLRLALTVAVIAIVLLVPTVAMANGWFLERNLFGMTMGVGYSAPDVSGDWVVLRTRAVVPGALWGLTKVDLRSGTSSAFASDPYQDVGAPAVDGYWVAYEVDSDIYVKNLATGVRKRITSDGDFIEEASPVISGKYVVWTVYGSTMDIYGKDFTSTKPAFPIAVGVGDQSDPSIHGTRVAYREALSPSVAHIKVKAIGSSAGARVIAEDTVDQEAPSIGSHLVAWRAYVGGHWMIRYHNFDTGETLDGPSSSSYDMVNPQVSGDRILYDVSNGSDQDAHVFDVRVRRASGVGVSSFPLPGTGADESSGKISGSACVYMSGGSPMWAKLAVPSLTIGSVPTRVPHHGHIHLKGTLSDQGVRIGGASLRVEKYSGGHWILVKTLTTSASGAYSYQTPTLHSKTKYRVAYDGNRSLFGAGVTQHFSAVSSVRTGWPL
jgi:hypothetical protein